MRRARQTRLARPDVGQAKLVVPDQLRRVASGRSLGIHNRNRDARLVLRRIYAAFRIPLHDWRTRRRLIFRQLDRHVRHSDAVAKLNRLRHARHVEDERLVLRAHHEVLDQARVICVLDRSGERVPVAIDRQVAVPELELVRPEVDVLVERKPHRHLVGILADGLQHQRARVDDLVPRRLRPTSRLAVQERDRRVDVERVTPEARSRKRHACLRVVAGHVRHEQQRSTTDKRLGEVHRLASRLAHDVHERNRHALALHVLEVHAERRCAGQGLTTVRVRAAVRANRDHVADHRNAGAAEVAAVQVHVAPDAAANRHVRHRDVRAALDVERIQVAASCVEHRVRDRNGRAAVDRDSARQRVSAAVERHALADRHALRDVRQQRHRVVVMRLVNRLSKRLVLAHEVIAIIIHRRDIGTRLHRV